MTPPAAAKPAPLPPDPATIARLRARIRALDGAAALSAEAGAPVALGAEAIDAALPWRGLPRGCLHELIGDDGSAAAAGFAALLLARFAAAGGSVVWCRRGGGPYPPGLAAFGLDPARLLVVRAGSEDALLWAMEDALRCRALAAVLGETRAPNPVAGRRLQLAAAANGVAAIVLRRQRPPNQSGATATAAVSRWRIAATAAGRWRLDLLRCRGGVPASWLVEWCDETHRLAVVAAADDRPAAAGIRRRAV